MIKKKCLRITIESAIRTDIKDKCASSISESERERVRARGGNQAIERERDRKLERNVYMDNVCKFKLYT